MGGVGVATLSTLKKKGKVRSTSLHNFWTADPLSVRTQQTQMPPQWTTQTIKMVNSESPLWTLKDFFRKQWNLFFVKSFQKEQRNLFEETFTAVNILVRHRRWHHIWFWSVGFEMSHRCELPFQDVTASSKQMIDFTAVKWWVIWMRTKPTLWLGPPQWDHSDRRQSFDNIHRSGWT